MLVYGREKEKGNILVEETMLVGLETMMLTNSYYTMGHERFYCNF